MIYNINDMNKVHGMHEMYDKHDIYDIYDIYIHIFIYNIKRWIGLRVILITTPMLIGTSKMHKIIPH